MANHPSIVAAKKIKVFVNNKDLPFSNMGRSLKKKKNRKDIKSLSVSVPMATRGDSRKNVLIRDWIGWDHE